MVFEIIYFRMRHMIFVCVGGREVKRGHFILIWKKSLS